MPPRDYYLPSRKLVSQDDASITQRADVPRSKFIGSWTRKTTFDAGYLVPFLVDEILPGDHMSYDCTAYIRMSTPLFPIFDQQRVDTLFFFVPNRLVWENWVKMMGEQDSPGDSINFTVPQIVSATGGFPVGSIYDHMGLPTVGQIGGGNTVSINALPLRAYNRIFNEWFRDQNIDTPFFTTKGNGPDNVASYNLQRRAKSHDYFTSCLPWPQKFTAPTIPLSGTAPISGISFDRGITGTSGNPPSSYETGFVTPAGWPAYRAFNATTWYGRLSHAGSDAAPEIFANLGAATGVTINVLRQAFLVQQLLERDARGGTRYVELIRSHFGVTNPDFRLQRPEYIGGGSSPFNITPIAQTAPTTGLTVGALGAAGTAVGSHRANYAATEHGYILGLINVRTELSYQQGIHKMWDRRTRYDFYWPALSGLGEQAVLRREIYATGASANDDQVFGYQERWQEYRTRTSEVCGIFRSTAAGTIDQWHLAQNFTGFPLLNSTFIRDTPPMSRVLAADTLANGQQYLADILIKRTATRAIPTFGMPATLGRF